MSYKKVSFLQINEDMDPKINGITTDKDLSQLLRGCSRCYKITNNTKFVMSHTNLVNLTLPKRFTKWVIIINTTGLPKSKKHENNPTETVLLPKLGHWVCCVIFNKTLYILDGLCKISQNTDVMLNIKTFCRSNNLTMEDVNLRFQVLNSTWCGYLACYFVAKASLLSQHSFLKVINLLRQHNVKSREKHMLQYVLRHFKKQN